MKSLIVLLMAIPLMAMAYYQNDSISWKATLFDGRVINLEKDVEIIYLHEGSIDAFGLFNREVSWRQTPSY